MAKIDLSKAEKTRRWISKTQQKAISDMYKKLAKQAEYEARSLKGRTNISSKLREQYLNQLAKELRTESDNVSKYLETTVKDNMQVVSEAVCKANKDFLAQIGLNISGAYLHVPNDVIKSLTSGKLYAGNWSLSKAIWGSNQKLKEDLGTIVARGIAMQKPTYEIAKDLEKYVDPTARKTWEWSKVYPGTNRVVDYNAQRLARTMIGHAYEQSFIATTQHNPFVSEYEWQASDSERTCQICLDRDGTRYAKDDLPLDHPNGLCTFIAVIPDDFNTISDKIAEWYKSPEGTFPDIDEFAASLTR